MENLSPYLSHPLPNARHKPAAQRKRDQVIDLHAPRADGAPAAARDGRRAHDGGAHGGGRGQDELVDVAVARGVGERAHLVDVGDVVVALVGVRRLAVALVALVAPLQDAGAREVQVEARGGGGVGAGEAGEEGGGGRDVVGGEAGVCFDWWRRGGVCLAVCGGSLGRFE